MPRNTLRLQENCHGNQALTVYSVRADFANLARDIKIATDAGAEYVHVDVMDGHFVPNITIGAPVVKALRKATDKVLDVHLMISDPDQYLDDFIKAGSDIITVHYESNGDTLEQLKKIRAAGVKAACVIKPKTPAECCSAAAVLRYGADHDR